MYKCIRFITLAHQEKKKKTGLTIPICFTNISKEIDIKMPNLEICESESGSRSVIADSLWPNELYSPWNSPGQNTGVGSHSFLQRIFPTQGSNLSLLHCRQVLFHLSHQVLSLFLCIMEFKSVSFSWMWINDLFVLKLSRPYLGSIGMLCLSDQGLVFCT